MEKWLSNIRLKIKVKESRLKQWLIGFIVLVLFYVFILVPVDNAFDHSFPSVQKIQEIWKNLFSSKEGYDVKVAFPYTLDSIKTENYACEALTGTYMYADKDEGVVARASKGTDKLAVGVKGDKLKFLTQASLEIGFVEGDEFDIIKNDGERLVAIYSSLDQTLGGYDGISVFILNKKNGIGIWSKTNQNQFLNDNPGTQGYQLHCK